MTLTRGASLTAGLAVPDMRGLYAVLRPPREAAFSRLAWPTAPHYHPRAPFKWWSVLPRTSTSRAFHPHRSGHFEIHSHAHTYGHRQGGLPHDGVPQLPPTEKRRHGVAESSPVHALAVRQVHERVGPPAGKPGLPVQMRATHPFYQRVHSPVTGSCRHKFIASRSSFQMCLSLFGESGFFRE